MDNQSTITPELLKKGIDQARTNPDTPFATELRKRIESGRFDRQLKEIGLERTPDGLRPYTPKESFIQEAFGDIQSVGTDIADASLRRSDKIDEIRKASQKGEQSKVRSVLQAAGQLAGSGADAITAAARGAVNLFLPEKTEKKITSTIEKGAQKIAGDDTMIGSLIERYDQIKKTNPALARDIDAALGVTDLAANFAGGTAAKKGLDVLETGVEQGIKQAKRIPDALSDFETGLSTNNPINQPRQRLSSTPEDRLVNLTKPVRSKKDVQAAISKEEGKVSRDIFGNHDITTARDIEVSQAARKYIDPKAKPEQNIENLKLAVSDIAENELKPFFAENPGNFDWIDMKDYLSNRMVPRQIFKADPTALRTYNRVRNNVLDIIGKYPHTNQGLWDARIAIDDMIEREFGDAIFGSPQGTAVKRAALDSRSAINDFITDNLVNKDMKIAIRAEEFLNEARRRGIKIDNIDEARKVIKQSLGADEILPEDELRAAFFKDKMKQMNLLYEARDNVAEQFASNFDKDAIERIMQDKRYRSIRNILIGLTTAGVIAGGASAVQGAVE